MVGESGGGKADGTSHLVIPASAQREGRES